MITPIYAALLALLFVFLSVRVIRVRRADKMALGTSGNARVERAARVQGNFAEYVPFALFLLYLLERSGASAWLVHALGLALLIGRASHAFGVSHEPEDFRFRVAGIALTFGVLISASLRLLADALT